MGNLRFPLDFTYHGCPRNSAGTPQQNAGLIFDPRISALFLELLERDEITINPLALVE
jgi:hypothetical protein